MKNLFKKEGILILAFIISLIASGIISGCARIKVPDFKAHITLPASGDGYYVKTVSAEEGRIPKEKWDQMVKRAVHLLKEDWAILRNTVVENCLGNAGCDDIVGFFDGLFKALDDAAKKLPKK